MNIQRFNAPTAREALAKARHAFGEGTLILSNRPTATGVEVVATAEDTLAALDTSESFANRSKDQPMLRRAALASVPESSTPVEEDATQLAMSTLSFQDYVRERMLRRRHESLSGQTAAGASQETAPEPTPQAVARPSPRQVETIEIQPPVKAVLAPKRAPVLAAAPAPALSQGIVNELHAMKALIEDRFNTLTWLGQARQSPIQS